MVCFFYSTAIAVRCKDGVVFGVEKLVLSKLYEEGSNKRIFNVDKHVGMVPLASSLLLSYVFLIYRPPEGSLSSVARFPARFPARSGGKSGNTVLQCSRIWFKQYIDDITYQSNIGSKWSHIVGTLAPKTKKTLF